jgi:hypothetical protein
MVIVVARKTVKVDARSAAVRSAATAPAVSERVVGHVESMDPDEILTRSAQFEKIDTIARRTFGLNDAPSCQGSSRADKSCGRLSERAERAKTY